MTDTAMDPTERATLMREMKHAVFANSHVPLDQTMVMWKPDDAALNDENLKKLHLLATVHGMNHSNAISVNQLIAGWKRSDNWDQNKISLFLDDLLTHLKAVQSEYEGLRFSDSESFPFFIIELNEIRGFLPEGESFTIEQERAFLLLLPFAPWYMRGKSYASFYEFIQSRSLDDARSALMLLNDSTVERIAEAESILDDKPAPLANGSL